MKTRHTVLLAAAALLTACGGTVTHGGGSLVQRLTVDQHERLLAFVNAGTTSFDLLDSTCALRSNAAANIIIQRDGADGTPGTSDDRLFKSVEALNAIPQVGAWTLDQLGTCADDQALIGFANRAPFEQLDIECKLRSDSARNLVARRDEALFTSLNEIDDVKKMGPRSMALLRDCAYANPLPAPTLPPVSTTPSTETIEHLSLLDPALAAAIQGPLQAVAETARDTSIGFPVYWASVDINNWDGRIDSYHVHYVQMIDPEGGIQLWITVDIDTDYEVIDVYAGI